MDESEKLEPFIRELDAGGELHLPLLTAENARRMRAGMVTLGPAEECGRHSTEAYEELLIILEGRGEAELEGHGALAVAAGQVAYIPPQTHHNVRGRGSGPLRYVYVVAPAGVAEGAGP
jgi:mannose-6-phosphate isomerase-like protein (cupin superfamily)